MIKVIQEGATYRPAVICDVCGEEIHPHGAGNYEWQLDERGKPKDCHLYFTHHECCQKFVEAHASKSGWFTGELGFFRSIWKLV